MENKSLQIVVHLLETMWDLSMRRATIDIGAADKYARKYGIIKCK